MSEVCVYCGDPAVFDMKICDTCQSKRYREACNYATELALHGARTPVPHDTPQFKQFSNDCELAVDMRYHGSPPLRVLSPEDQAMIDEAGRQMMRNMTQTIYEIYRDAGVFDDAEM